MKPKKTKGISLHLGLNYVDPNHYKGWNGELNCCIDDAKFMKKIAKHYNYSESILLSNESATRKNVITAISDAANNLKKGDIFFITYSGHGGKVKDIDGDEIDGIDETWCLFDGQIIDDELKELWSKFEENVRVLVISDSCHSGTITREPISEFNSFFQEFIERSGYKSRNMPKSKGIEVYRENKEFYDNLRKGANESLDIKASIKLISGCQDNQLSYEGFGMGQFTEALQIVWAEGRFNKGYSVFHQEIMNHLPAYQTPNYFDIGKLNTSFDNQSPFQI